MADAPPAYQTVLPKTSLFNYVLKDEDSRDQGRSKESRLRTQKPQPSSSRREYDKDESDKLPAEERRRDRQKTTTKPSHLGDRRSEYGSRDDGIYGGSRWNNGNRARDQTQSRYSSRTAALVKHGESSRAVSKRDSRSKAYTKSTGSTRAKDRHSDVEEEITISRYIAADFDELLPESVLELSNLLDVRVGKIKQWCERDLIRRDNATGLIDIQPLVKEVDEEDAKKLKRFMKNWRMKEKPQRYSVLMTSAIAMITLSLIIVVISLRLTPTFASFPAILDH